MRYTQPAVEKGAQALGAGRKVPPVRSRPIRLGGGRSEGDPGGDNRGPLGTRSLRYLQENLRRSGPAIAASYALIGAIVLFGGIGYAVDRWQETAPWFAVAGLLLGVIVGLYEIAKIVWPR
jgi:hypothetical protein